MLRRNLFGLAVAALLGLSLSGTMAEAEPQATADAIPQSSSPATSPASGPPASPMPDKPAVTIAQSASCVSDCQAQHDRCRVITKGSRSCDEERQRCLEICLQKKRK